MAIFSRRTIQRLIYENDNFTNRKDLKEQVDKLNRQPNKFISTEWELIILNVLNKFGVIEHHKKFDGNTKPDIFFSLDETIKNSFVAEVVAVSDDGKNKQNPVEELDEWLGRTVSEFGYNPNNFELRLGGNYGSKLYKTKTELKIPSLALINNSENLLGIEFINFLKNIPKSSNPIMIYKDSKYNLSVIYSEYSKYSSMLHLSYNEITSLVNNAVYSNLETKADQLKKAQTNLPLGIFICDGGFESFASMSSLHSYSLNEVIKYFLESFQNISFVFATTVEQDDSNGRGFRIKTKIYKGAEYESLGKEIQTCLNELQNYFPCPQMTSTSALNIFREKYSNQGKPFLGCYSVMKNEVRISSRAIIELLSGEISQKEFFDIHEFDSENEKLKINDVHKNPFNLFKDKNILEVEIEVGENEADDDWLIFKFGKSDPSKAKFNLPQDEKEHKN